MSHERLRGRIMRVSITFDGSAPVNTVLGVAQAADAAGLDGVWLAEHVGMRDAVVQAALCLSSTEQLEIGIVGLNPGGRHPGVMAMELANLATIGVPGRLRVAVGTGDPALGAAIGYEMKRPITMVNALVSSLRAALTGQQLDGDHPGFSFRGFQLSARPPIVPPRIDIMAVRPK